MDPNILLITSEFTIRHHKATKHNIRVYLSGQYR